MPPRPRRAKGHVLSAGHRLASTWDPDLLRKSSLPPPPKPAPAAFSNASRPSSISIAIRAGAAPKKPTAKIRISSHASESQPSPAFRGTGPGLDKITSWPRPNISPFTASPKAAPTFGPALYSERVIREYWLKPFEAAVKEAHVATVMPSYNEIDGIPNHSNKHL